MDKFLADRIQLTVDNYRLVKEELRNDGDIINHFASLIFSHYEREIPIYRVKEIRKNIKLNTTRISPFRGDTLNILSLLIATVDKEEEEELIVGEVEEGVKRNQVLIGDGDEDADFEFL